MPPLSLNPEQQAVVEHLGGPLRVSACPGSGKTATVVERVAYLIEKRHVSPRAILAITFSRDACDEMRKRIDARLPRMEVGKICARTFHSLGLEIYTNEIDPNREIAIDTSGIMHKKAITQAYKALGLRPECKLAGRYASLVKNRLLGADPVLARLGRADPAMFTLAERVVNTEVTTSRSSRQEAAVSPDQLLQCYYKTEAIRTTTGVPDRDGSCRTFVGFDDMLYESALLLRRQAIGEKWASRWQWVIQDECQDINDVQAAIAEVLCRRHRNYMVVGDANQSVYAFRGSEPRHLIEFPKEWPGTKTVTMHRNYRSGIEIVDFANRITDAMPADSVVSDDLGDESEMVSERQTHAYVGLHTFASSHAEAIAIAENVRLHHEQGVPYEGQAVLLRMNRMTRDVEMALATAKIPYRLGRNSSSFFTMKEAKIVFGYLRLLLGRGTEEDASFALMYPSRGIGRVVVDAVAKMKTSDFDWIEAAARVNQSKPSNKLASWISFMRDLRLRLLCDAATFIRRLRERARFDEWLKRDAEDSEDDRGLDNMEAVCTFAEVYSSVTELVDAIDLVAAHQQTNAKKRKAVTVSTVHKAKGAQWDVVYVPQLLEGLFPAKASSVTEERRCFYVACTRARDELWLSYPEVRDTGVSVFLHETGLQLTPFVAGRPMDTQTAVRTQLGLSL